MVKPIRILFMIDALDDKLGGTENQLIKLLSGLNREKFHVHLLCFDNRPWFQKNAGIFQCDVSVISLYKFTRVATYINFIKLIKFIKKYDPHVVHTFFPVGNILGVVAARLAGIKNIISSRRDYGEWMNGRYLAATRIANKFVTKIIANSCSVKKLTEEKERTGKDQVDVIYNGIDAPQFCNVERDVKLKKSLGVPLHDKVVGIVANFRPMKHHATFVKAAAEILAARSDVSFVLVGTGTIQKELDTLGSSLNISHKLIFAGPQDNVIPFLSIMDVGVNCSEREGLSNAVMEYMAMGIPCVVSNAGGNTDLITHDVHGYLFELDDYTTLAKLVQRLLDDKTTGQRLAENARKKIAHEMSIETMLFKSEKLYLSMAQQ